MVKAHKLKLLELFACTLMLPAATFMRKYLPVVFDFYQAFLILKTNKTLSVLTAVLMQNNFGHVINHNVGSCSASYLKSTGDHS